jgi:hypothetical protein
VLYFQVKVVERSGSDERLHDWFFHQHPDACAELLNKDPGLLIHVAKLDHAAHALMSVPQVQTQLSTSTSFRLDWRRQASIAVGHNCGCGRSTLGPAAWVSASRRSSVPAARRPTMAASTKPRTKSATVTRLLSRDKGATLDEIAKATEWKAHSCRAFLTSIRKKARVLRQERPDGATSYRIVQETAAEPTGE